MNNSSKTNTVLLVILIVIALGILFFQVSGKTIFPKKQKVVKETNQQLSQNTLQNQTQNTIEQENNMNILKGKRVPFTINYGDKFSVKSSESNAETGIGGIVDELIILGTADFKIDPILNNPRYVYPNITIKVQRSNQTPVCKETILINGHNGCYLLSKNGETIDHVYVIFHQGDSVEIAFREQYSYGTGPNQPLKIENYSYLLQDYKNTVNSIEFTN